jgi:hypothetical protein
LPHWLGTPPPPHVSGKVQEPQFAVTPPQPSAWEPQVPAGKLAQVFGLQMAPPSGATPLFPPQMLAPPPPQNCGLVQVPQLMRPPQPSAAWPQFWPAGHVVAGTQGTPPSGFSPVLPPHWLKPPPPQNWDAGQVPQSMTLPQPSPVEPQL